MSSGCNLILSDIPAFRELTTHALFADVSKTMPHPDCLGDLADTSVDSLITQLRKYTKLSFKDRTQTSELIRKEYEARHQAWMDRFLSMKLPLETE